MVVPEIGGYFMGRNNACQLAGSNPVLDIGSRAAARELREIAKRRAVFGEVVSADTGWSLLLWMLVLEEDGSRISIGGLLREAAVSDDTGRRWLGVLAQSGLVVLDGGEEKRQGSVALSHAGRNKLISVLNF